MLAIDTNIIVRYLTDDDPAQAARARALIRDHEVLATSTVLLETEWVLRSLYGYDRRGILKSLTGFVALPKVRISEPERMSQAMRLAADGMDFADALHLAGAEGCEAFMTFDRRLIAVSAVAI